MEVGTIFPQEQYDEAYKFATENGYDIVEVGSKEEKRIVEVIDVDEEGNVITREVEETVIVRYFQIVEKPLPAAPTYEEVKQIRASLYRSEVDPLMNEYTRKKTFNLFEEGEEEALLAEIEAKVEEIKNNNPYPEE